MTKISPRIAIEGEGVDFLKGNYKIDGGLKSATLTFSVPSQLNSQRKLWNKEVTFFLNSEDTAPIFRGWIKRLKEDYNEIQIHAEDALGYLLKGGEQSEAIVALTEESNIDGLTVGAAVKKLFELGKLDTKLGTSMIGDTTPVIGVTQAEPIRGTKKIMEVIKELLNRVVDNSGTIPRPNIARLIDDGSMSQFIIELESDIDNDPIVHTYNEWDNIIEVSILKRKVPTVIVVNGADNVKGTFTHDTAIAAFDRTYLEVSNDDLKSGAECKDFAQKLFRANLKNQYEYKLTTMEGAYLSENDVISINTDNDEFSGTYRVIGKQIAFSPSEYKVGISINRKPPTLAEYISSRDN